MAVSVVDAGEEYWRYVSLCTHVDERRPDTLRAAEMRLEWLRQQAVRHGMRTKVALGRDGKPLGFVHMLPVESPLSGMIGRGLTAIPCLTIDYQLVYAQRHGTGVGRALMQACEAEARASSKGLAVYAYGGDFWFMPSAFFQKMGFVQGSKSPNIWVKRWADIEDPVEPVQCYEYAAVPGKVAIDYFWSPFCFTVCKEALNIRDVAREFGDEVVLREHRADDPESFARYGMLRALFINGKSRFWGYEAPKEELRKEITKALQDLS